MIKKVIAFILMCLLVIVPVVGGTGIKEVRADVTTEYPEFFENSTEDLSKRSNAFGPSTDGIVIKSATLKWDESVASEDKDSDTSVPLVVLLGDVKFGTETGDNTTVSYVIEPNEDSVMAVIYNEDGSVAEKYTLKDCLAIPENKIGSKNIKYLPIELSPGETIRYRTIAYLDSSIYYGDDYTTEDDELFGHFIGGSHSNFLKSEGGEDDGGRAKYITDSKGKKLLVTSQGIDYISHGAGSGTHLLPSGVMFGLYYEENTDITIKPANVFNTLSFKKIDEDTREELHGWEFEVYDLNDNLIKKVTDNDFSLDLNCILSNNNDFMKYGNVKEVYCYNENGDKVTLISSNGPIWTDGDNDLKNIFKFRETKAPDNYILNDTEMTVSTRVYINQSMDAIEYSVDNEDIAFDSSDGTIVVKNKKDLTKETIDISGKKTWNDAGNQDGKRPNSITVNLLADGEEVDEKQVTDDKWIFENLPKYKDGKEIAYTITEDEVDGYTTIINGYNITNTYAPEKIKVEGKKTWDDNNNQDGIRPESITVNLLADGVEIDERQVTNDKWSFDNLPKYKDGKEIVYTITEDEVDGYTTEIHGYNITNKHVIEYDSIKISKYNNEDYNFEKGEFFYKPLEGAEFAVINVSGTTIEDANGVEIPHGGVIATMRTNADGYAETEPILPVFYNDPETNNKKYTKYVLAETKTPEGYHIDNSFAQKLSEYVDNPVTDNVIVTGQPFIDKNNNNIIDAGELHPKSNSNGHINILTFEPMDMTIDGKKEKISNPIYAISNNKKGGYYAIRKAFSFLDRFNPPTPCKFELFVLDSEGKPYNGTLLNRKTYNSVEEINFVDGKCIVTIDEWNTRYGGLYLFIPENYSIKLMREICEGDVYKPYGIVEFDTLYAGDFFSYPVYVEDFSRIGYLDTHFLYPSTNYRLLDNYSIDSVAWKPSKDTAKEIWEYALNHESNKNALIPDYTREMRGLGEYYVPKHLVLLNNTYNSKIKTNINLMGKKLLSSADINKYNFKFALKEGDKILQTTTNKGNQIAFNDILIDNINTVRKEVNDFTENDWMDVEYIFMLDDTILASASLPQNYMKQIPDEARIHKDGDWIYYKDASEELKNNTTWWEYYYSSSDDDVMFVTDNLEIYREYIKQGKEHDERYTFYSFFYDDIREYTITEILANGNEMLNGIKYDTHDEKIKVHITGAVGGEAKIDIEYDDDGVVFTNEYDASGSAIIKANKTITGRNLENGQFAFELKKDGKVIDTAANQNGEVVFKPIEYTIKDVDKEYTYTINEVNDKKPGYTYDTHTETITVAISDNGDGTLRTDIKTDNDGIVFNNTYTANGSTSFSGKKILNNKTMDTFTFELKEGDKLISETTNDTAGDFSFKGIEYTLDDVGTHTYTISEKNDGKGGIDYDTHTETVTVEVSDNGDGTLKTDIKTDVDGVVFNNTYSASGSAQISATKNLTGRDIKDGEFEFDLKKNGELIETVRNIGNKITFSMLQFVLNDIGVHTYSIIEKAGSLGGVAYDDHTETVTIEVSDNGNGTLNTDVKYDDNGPTFNNTYTSTGKASLAGTKTLSGRSLKDGEFAFELREGDTLVETVTNKDGKITFSEINYDLSDVGTHTYTISEKIGNALGIDYDTHTETITVEVTDNGDGSLKANVKTDADGIVFNNIYTASGKTSFEGTKTLTGRDLKNNEFEFELKEGDNIIETVTNKDGKITFSEINYDLSDVGTHTYTISEKRDNVPGIDYDTHTETVTVEVSDNGDGTLKTDVKTDTDGITFNNNYSAFGNATFEGTKNIRGRTMDAFSFLIKEGDTEVATVENDTDGVIKFPQINYTLNDVGTHEYTITEINDNKPCITYDTHEEKVQVIVSDNGDGTLKTEIKTDSDGVTFNNSFTKDVYITKTDIGGKELEGAHIVVTGDNFKEEWDSTTEPHKLILEAGTYTFTETVAPKGYDLVETVVKFTITDDGTVTLDNPDDKIKQDGNNIILIDDATVYDVKINKTDLNGTEIENAQIKVTGTDIEGNNISKEWISKKDETFDLSLKAGDYTFEEVSAPEGYVKVETKIDFIVEKDGTVVLNNTTVTPAGAVEYKDGILFLKNELKNYDVKINKTDMNGVEIENAKIKVTGENFEQEWISKKDQTMDISLKPGNYTLVELNAPEGFIQVTTEISFTVALDGTVTVNTTDVEPEGAVEYKDGVIILKNKAEEPIDEPTTTPEEPTTIPDTPTEEPKVTGNVETGDPSPLPYILLTIFALSGIAVTGIAMKKRSKR